MNAYFLKWNLKIHDTAKKIGDRWLKNKWNVDKCKEKKKVKGHILEIQQR